MSQCVLGIDPGMNGAICCLDGDSVATSVMPTIGNCTDESTLYNILKGVPRPKMVFLESVHASPLFGAKGNFKLGTDYGLIKGILFSLSLPYTEVSPQRWQKIMHQGISSTLKPKERSLLALNRRFPGMDVRATGRSTKPHDGIVDAILIAHYGYFQLESMAKLDIN